MHAAQKMNIVAWLFSFLFLCVGSKQGVQAVTGKGPVGVHPINERYIVVADSSIDAVLIIDGNAGGSVVGHFVLHDRESDPVDADKHIGGKKPIKNWINPLSIATCAACNNLFVTSPNMFYKIKLDRTLSEMAELHDFSDFSNKSEIREFWPKNWSNKFRGDGYLRMVSVAPDGSSGYVSHSKGGVFSFNPLLARANDPSADHVIRIGVAGIDEQEISGLHHTHSLKNLVLTSSGYVHIVKLKDENGNNPLDEGKVTAYKLPLNYHCDYLYGGNKMTFLDTVIINEYAFVLGQPIEQGIHNGVAIYRLTWDMENEGWSNCIQVAGSGSHPAAWVDGEGTSTRFSMTPHDIAHLPSMTHHMIVVADVDNRALRYVDVTLPVETADEMGTVTVSSAFYDEDLWYVLYKDEEPWNALSPEEVMKSDGKSYYQSGPNKVYRMTFAEAQDECSRVGIGRICTLPQIRARFARGQYPSIDGDDNSWTTVWTNEACSSCHLQDPGACAVGDSNSWGTEYKMIANFSPREGLHMKCTNEFEKADVMSMCCGLGGPAVMDPKPSEDPKKTQSSVSAANASTETKPKASSSGGVIASAVLVPLIVIATIVGLVMRRRAKPSWWPRFFRNDQREETGHAPHREIDLRGKDYI